MDFFRWSHVVITTKSCTGILSRGIIFIAGDVAYGSIKASVLCYDPCFPLRFLSVDCGDMCYPRKEELFS